MSFTVKFLLWMNAPLILVFLIPGNPTSLGQKIILWCLASLCTLIYFAPGLIAQERGKRNALSIWLLNIFLGWTVVGWVVAIVWATTTSDADKPQQELGDVPCVACFAPVNRYATKCRHCATDLKPHPKPINPSFKSY